MIEENVSTRPWRCCVAEGRGCLVSIHGGTNDRKSYGQNQNFFNCHNRPRNRLFEQRFL